MDRRAQGTALHDVVASHIAALAWMGLRHLPKRPEQLVTATRP